MKITIPREDTAAEKRVPIVPESVKRLVAKKIDVSVEAGAGEALPVQRRADYKAAGATIEPSREALFAGADAIIRVRIPTPGEISAMKEGPFSSLPALPAGSEGRRGRARPVER